MAFKKSELIEILRSSWQTWFTRNNGVQLLNLYIGADCVESQYSQAVRHNLDEVVQNFLNDTEEQLLLVLGDSGSGKTSLTLKLERDYWKNEEVSKILKKYILIRIDLKSFNTSNVNCCIETTLRDKYQLTEQVISDLKKESEIEILVIFDGYDEIGGRAEFNIFKESGLNQWNGRIKSIVTCRSQHFSDIQEFKKCFELRSSVLHTKLTDALKVICLAPFSEAQMKAYLKACSKVMTNKKNAAQFPLKEIEKLLKKQKDFKELISNPFVLRIFSEVAPKLLNSKREASVKITRIEIYQAFLEDWFDCAKERLEQSVRNSEIKSKVRNIKGYFFGYAQRLAFTYFREGITELEYKKPTSIEEEFEEYKLIEEGNTAFREFFSDEKPEMIEARKACPLRRSGESTYSFVHKSFQDYLAARHLYLVLKSANEKLMIENWNKRYLSEDRAVLRFLSELVESDEKRKELEERLLQIIQSSKQGGVIDAASSNAISVLNWNRYSFAGMDLQGIRVPKAYLEGVNFSGANLSASQLTGSYVRNSEWSEANLEGSDLRGLEFGEYPDWEQGSEVTCLVFNTQGTLVASGDDEGYLRLWRYPDGELLRSWEGHKGGINSVSFSVDGRRLASGGWDKTIRIWSVKSGVAKRVLVGHTALIRSVSWSVDGKRLASGSDDRTIRIWSVKSGVAERVLMGHLTWIRSVSWSVDGKRLVSGSDDCTIILWSVENGEEEQVLVGHMREVTSVDWSVDGKRLASGSNDRTIRVWDVERGIEERVLVGHTSYVTSVNWSIDGKRLASSSYDRTIRVWEVESGEEERVLVGHMDWVRSVNWSIDGKRLASGSADCTIRLWDVERGIEERVVMGHRNSVTSVSWSGDGKRLASGSYDTTARIWGVESGVEERVLVGHIGIVTSVNWCDKEEEVASGSVDGTIRVWEVKGGIQERVFVGHTSEVTSVSWSGDRKRLASGSYDKTIRIWLVKSGVEERVLVGHEDWVTSVNWSIDGKRLVSGSADCTIRIWLVKSGVEERVLVGHEDWVTSVNWSIDGKRLVSGSVDCTIRLWDVESGVEERVLMGHRNSVTSVSWSGDGKWLASGGGDRTIRLWNAEDNKCTEVAVFNQEVWSVSFCKSRDRREEYLAAGIGSGVYLFFIEKESLDAELRLILKWRTNFYLQSNGANLENVLIDDMNRRLLEQRGAKKANPNLKSQENVSDNSSTISEQDHISVVSSDTENEININSLETFYLNAALLGDFDLMQRLYNSLMDVNFGTEAKPQEKRSTLHWACYHRNIEAMEFLLSKNASINLRDINGQTPLHIVLLPRFSETNHKVSEDTKIQLNLISQLLSNKARIDLMNTQKKTVIDLSYDLAIQEKVLQPEFLFKILIKTQQDEIVKLTKLMKLIFKSNFNAFKQDISACLNHYKNPEFANNKFMNQQILNQILKNLLFIDKVEYEVFQYLAHLRDKGGMVTDAGGKFIPAVIDASSNAEKIKVVFPKTENGWIQGQSFEGWSNVDFLTARMHLFIQIWLDYKKGFLETGLSDGLKKLFEERLEREIYYGITACRIAQINQQLPQLAKDNPLKGKLRVVFNRILCQCISQLPEGHIFYYPTGNQSHSVYVNFKRLPKNQMGIWVDNVGDEHEAYGHTIISPEKKINPMSRRAEVSGHKKVLSCSLGKLSALLFKDHAVDVEAYLKNLSKAETKPGRQGLDKVYLLPSDLETEDYKPEFQPKRELTKGHCVLRNHNVGLLNRFFYRMPEETEGDSEKKPGRVLYRIVKEREELTLLRMK